MKIHFPVILIILTLQLGCSQIWTLLQARRSTSRKAQSRHGLTHPGCSCRIQQTSRPTRDRNSRGHEESERRDENPATATARLPQRADKTDSRADVPGSTVSGTSRAPTLRAPGFIFAIAVPGRAMYVGGWHLSLATLWFKQRRNGNRLPPTCMWQFEAMASLAGHVTCGRDRCWLRAKARRALSKLVRRSCERRGLDDDHDRLTVAPAMPPCRPMAMA
jgi:hypothetical protein